MAIGLPRCAEKGQTLDGEGEGLQACCHGVWNHARLPGKSPLPRPLQVGSPCCPSLFWMGGEKGGTDLQPMASSQWDGLGLGRGETGNGQLVTNTHHLPHSPWGWGAVGGGHSGCKKTPHHLPHQVWAMPGKSFPGMQHKVLELWHFHLGTFARNPSRTEGGGRIDRQGSLGLGRGEKEVATSPSPTCCLLISLALSHPALSKGPNASHPLLAPEKAGQSAPSTSSAPHCPSPGKQMT